VLNINVAKTVNQDNSDLFASMLSLSSLRSVSLDLLFNEFVPSLQFNRFLSYSSRLTELRLSNLHICDKSQLLYFCQSLAANSSLTSISFCNVEFLDKFKQQVFKAIHQRKAPLAKLELRKCKVDGLVVPCLAAILDKNKLSLVEVVLADTLQERPKFLNFPVIFKSLGALTGLRSLQLREPFFKLGEEAADQLRGSLSRLTQLRKLEVSMDNYLDVSSPELFNSSLEEMQIESSSFDRFSTNKLYFDICAQA